MTVYAHIKTTRAIHDYSSISFGSKNSIDVWFVTVSQSLSDKTASEVREILGINTQGIWITVPYENKFWVVTNTTQEFNVQEFASADLENIYTMFEIDEALAQKADIEHTHTSNEILDLNNVIEENMAILSDDINAFLDAMIQELLN